MSLNRIDELLDAKRDGTLDPAAEGELERLLEQNPAACRRAADLEVLARTLDEARDDQPPARLVPEVMQRIARLSARPTVAHVIQWMPRSDSRGGRPMAKKVMFGVAAVAALILISVAITGFPKVNSTGTLGSIGAAKRAQTPQISAADVKTADPAVQQFMQSETFDRLVKDPNTKKMLADSSIRTMLADANIQAALSRGDFQRAMADANIQAALASDAMKAAMADSALVAAFSKADFCAALAKGDLQAALAASGFQSALAKSDLEAAFAKDDVRAALASPALQAALADSSLQAAMSKAGFRYMLSDANMQAALSSSAFAAALQSPGFAAALQDSAFAAAFSRE